MELDGPVMQHMCIWTCVIMDYVMHTRDQSYHTLRAHITLASTIDAEYYRLRLVILHGGMTKR
eukprot:14728514-Ditylum_brightwellii.AAC.1